MNEAWRRARSHGLSGLLVLASVCVVSGTPAAPTRPALAFSEAETLEVSAARVDLDTASDTLLLKGDVRLRLGELELSCERVDVRYDERQNLRSARGSGGVLAKLKGVEARANAVELELPKRSLRLSGQVRLSRGSGFLLAEAAEVDLVTRKISLAKVRGSIPLAIRER